MYKICFTISLFHASTCFKYHVLIVRRSELYYTASVFAWDIKLKQLLLSSLSSFFFIIIIICHELGLERSVSASSSSLFKGLPSYLHPSGLEFSIIFGILLLIILVTCCSQFGVILVSRQLVLLSTHPKFLHSFCHQKGCTQLFFWKFSLNWCQSFFILFSKDPNFASIYKTG